MQYESAVSETGFESNDRFLAESVNVQRVAKLESLVRQATSPARINIADGFKIDLLYSVPMEKQGSWVAMCMDDKNRLIVSDQYGGLYRFPVPEAGKNVDPSTIEQITYSTEKPGMNSPTDAQKKLLRVNHLL